MDALEKTPYEKYLEEAHARREEAARMHADGKRVPEIARTLGITQQRVYQILGSVKDTQPGSVPQ